MKIINQTKQTTLAEDVIKPTKLFDQIVGLLKHPQPIALILHTRFGIHTFMMKYPIDVLILDATNHVVATKPNLKPNTIYIWNIRYSTVIELPAGTIKQTKTKLNDKITGLS